MPLLPMWFCQLQFCQHPANSWPVNVKCSKQCSGGSPACALLHSTYYPQPDCLYTWGDSTGPNTSSPQKRILNASLHMRGRGEGGEGRTILEMGVHHESADHRPHIWWYQGLVWKSSDQKGCKVSISSSCLPQSVPAHCSTS